MTNFNEFGLSESLLHTLTAMGFTAPTPVQAKTIPFALEGRDVLGSAQTGTGKTGAFAIPLVEKILGSDDQCGLILTPTRELAKQVMDVVHQMLGRKTKIKTAFIIGGEPYPKQLSQLRNNPRIIVGTPGRVNDHLDRRTLKLDNSKFLILDETDRMLDMGFGVQLDRILTHMPKDRQTLMFSATLPDAIIKMSKKYLQNPERVSVGATNIVAPKIKQEIMRVQQADKYGVLLDQLKNREGTVIIFMKTKHSTERMAKRLQEDGHTADALHGDLRQSKRTRVLQNFRNKKFRILVATDIAARGLDVPHIEHVVNHDLPQLAEDYIHRMGRTARAGADGSALVFISGQDGAKWREIEKLLGIKSSGPEHRERKGGGGKGKKPFHKKKAFGNGPAGQGQGGKRKPFGEKKTFGEKKSYGDRPSRDGETRDRSFGEKKRFTKKSDNDNRGEGRFDKKKSNTRNDRDDRNNDNQSRSDKPANGFKKKWSGEKKSFSEKKSYGDRPARDGEKKPFAKRDGKPNGFKGKSGKPFQKTGGKKVKSKSNNSRGKASSTAA